jgi:ParB/RepB/Spo0J family partition protein
MTSGNFAIVHTSSITINRDRRQRREVTNVEELAESISRLGLIHPPVVTRELVLVAGERRLTAIRHLGWESLPIQYADDLDESELHAIELEENIKRIDLTWQDQVTALQEYHSLMKTRDPAWTQEKTASAIGLKQNTVSEQLKVAAQLSDPRIADAPKFSVARGIVQRNAERADQQAVVEFRGAVGTPAERAKLPEPETIHNTSFLDWAPTYSGIKYNFVHCDFPYGIGAESFNQGAAAAHGGYDDSEENYWNLCKALANNLDRLTTPSCHLVFWFSMRFYRETLDFFSRETDFLIDPFPLIWMKSDNVGILPDPQRGPRRIYETALLGRRGDRKVVQAVANAYAAPTVRERHMSEKPEPVLRHFFRMLVDENSIVLDPTCGSGSAIRAAESLGAKFTTGLEINPEYTERARLALRQFRAGMKAAEIKNA